MEAATRLEKADESADQITPLSFCDRPDPSERAQVAVYPLFFNINFYDGENNESCN